MFLIRFEKNVQGYFHSEGSKGLIKGGKGVIKRAKGVIKGSKGAIKGAKESKKGHTILSNRYL